MDECDEENEMCVRYDKNNPVRGLQQITRGFQKWCARYIAECGTKAKPPRNPTPAEVMSKRFGDFQKKLNAALLASQADGR